jgi:hypothetical protein
MMKNIIIFRGVIVIALTLVLSCAAAQGAPIYDSGTASITHDADLNAPLPPDVSVAINPIPIFPPAPTQYPVNTLSKTVGDDTSTSTGKAGIGHVTEPTVFGLSFPGGTGVDQDDTAGLFEGAASLLIIFSATWDIDLNGFGPGISAWANFPLTGEVGQGGGWVELRVVATFTSQTHGSLRDPIIMPLFFNNTPGPYSVTALDIEEVLPPKNSLPPGDIVTISGSAEFRAKSGTGGESSIWIPQGLSGGIPEPCTITLLALSAPMLLRLRRK